LLELAHGLGREVLAASAPRIVSPTGRRAGAKNKTPPNGTNVWQWGGQRGGYDLPRGLASSLAPGRLDRLPIVFVGGRGHGLRRRVGVVAIGLLVLVPVLLVLLVLRSLSRAVAVLVLFRVRAVGVVRGRRHGEPPLLGAPRLFLVFFFVCVCHSEKGQNEREGGRGRGWQCRRHITFGKILGTANREREREGCARRANARESFS
jgi:hypothetical protein